MPSMHFAGRERSLQWPRPHHPESSATVIAGLVPQLHSIRAELSSDLVINGEAVSNPRSAVNLTRASSSGRKSSATMAGHFFQGDKQSRMGDRSNSQALVQLRQAVQRRHLARPHEVEEQVGSEVLEYRA